MGISTIAQLGGCVQVYGFTPLPMFESRCLRGCLKSRLGDESSGVSCEYVVQYRPRLIWTSQLRWFQRRNPVVVRVKSICGRFSTPFSMSWLRAFAGDLYQAAWQTVYTYFRTWRKDETWFNCMTVCETGQESSRSVIRVHRKQSSTVKVSRAAMVSQSVVRCGQTHQGRKRFLTVDSLGLVLRVLVTTASVGEREGGKQVLKQVKRWVKACHVCIPFG